MKLSHVILMSVIILFINVNGYSQGTVNGSVNAYPPNGITITLVDESNTHSWQTITDHNGIFEFHNVPAGDYYLTFAGRYVQSNFSQPFAVGTNGLSGLRYVLTPTTPALIATAYAVAILAGEHFVVQVENSHAWFESDPEFYTCANELSSQLSAQALAQPSYNDAYESAANVAANTGVPLGLAKDVAGDMAAASGDMMQLARGMRELSTAVREILQGNPNYYYNTELYQYAQISQYMFSQLPLAGIDPDAFYAYIFNLSFHMTYAYTSMVCG